MRPKEEVMATTAEHRQRVLDRLLKAWERYPHQRLCQLIYNRTYSIAKTKDGMDNFYVTDEQLVEVLDKDTKKT